MTRAAWYRTTRDRTSHHFKITTGAAVVRAECGELVVIASLVVASVDNKRCASCRRKLEGESP